MTEVITDQIGPTLSLTLGALAVAWLISLVITVLTVRRGRVLTAIGSGFEALSASLPHYWLGVILLVVFAVQLGWFPVIGGSGPSTLVLPILTLFVFPTEPTPQPVPCQQGTSCWSMHSA